MGYSEPDPGACEKWPEPAVSFESREVTMYGVLLIPLAAIVVFVTVRTTKKRRREKALSTPFDPQWEKHIENNLPVYRRLPPPLRDKLQHLIKIFLYEKIFEGCAGLAMTDEIRVTIAAQASMLLLNREGGCYPGIDSILVYPHAFIAANVRDERGYFSDAEIHIGEAWRTGVIILAWDEVLHGAVDPMDGHNVVLHEFAHALDQEDGISKNVPVAGKNSSYLSWARVFSAEFAALATEAAGGIDSVMDVYGATSMPEFFAVATEGFIEKPWQMKLKHGELYDLLREYYDIDPANWTGA